MKAQYSSTDENHRKRENFTISTGGKGQGGDTVPSKEH